MKRLPHLCVRPPLSRGGEIRAQRVECLGRHAVLERPPHKRSVLVPNGFEQPQHRRVHEDEQDDGHHGPMNAGDEFL